MQLFLKKCHSGHLDDLVEISRSTFKVAFAHLNDPADFEFYLDRAFSKDTLENELNNPESSFYFVYYDNELAGYFKLNKAVAQTDIHDDESLEVERIYVDKKYQGKKIGRWMMDQIIDIAKNERKKYLWLGVWEVNQDAIRFYQANGFAKFGEHPYYIGKDKQMDWLMRLDITTLQPQKLDP